MEFPVLTSRGLWILHLKQTFGCDTQVLPSVVPCACVHCSPQWRASPEGSLKPELTFFPAFISGLTPVHKLQGAANYLGYFSLCIFCVSQVPTRLNFLSVLWISPECWVPWALSVGTPGLSIMSGKNKSWHP